MTQSARVRALLVNLLSTHRLQQSRTFERVVQAAAQLDYIASPTASGLASGRSRLIGIITPFMARWFFTGIMSAIEKTLREHQHHILLMDLERSETSMSRLSLTQGMLFKRVDGLIVIIVEMQDAERDLVRRLVMKHADMGVIEQAAREQGMRTMYEDGLIKALSGTTTLEEVMRVCQDS